MVCPRRVRQTNDDIFSFFASQTLWDETQVREIFSYPARKNYCAFAEIFFLQGSLDFSHSFGYGGVVSARLDLSALVCCDMYNGFFGLWSCRTLLSWESSSRGRESLHYQSIFSGSLQEAVWFPVRGRVIDDTCSRRVNTRSRNCDLRSTGAMV